MKSPTRGGVAVPLPVGGGGPVGVPGGGAWWHARLYGPEGGYPAGPPGILFIHILRPKGRGKIEHVRYLENFFFMNILLTLAFLKI